MTHDLGASVHVDADGSAEPWQREACRLHERYLVEIVEACGLCPWAERARLQGRTTTAVLLQVDDAAFEPCLAALDEWAADTRLDIGFLVLPRLPLGRLDFDRFVARLQAIYAGRLPPGQTPFALAAFHPDAAPIVDDAERLIPFLRRTPDPCIQVVRMSTLKRVRGSTPEGTQFIDVASLEASLLREAVVPLRQRIARTNLDTVRRMGVAQFAACVEDIQRDRDRTYAALGGLPAQ
jgi:hypothetical protein